MDGLTRLEYRGYDSAGVAAVGQGCVETRKRAGKLANLVSALDDAPLPERLAHVLLDAVSDAIVHADRDGTIRFWNPGAERIFGFAAAEAVGKSLDLIIPEAQRARHWSGVSVPSLS